MNVRSHAQSRNLVCTPGVCCHVSASSTRVVLLCTSLFGTVHRIVIQCPYLKPRMSGSKHQSSGDIAGTTVLFQVLNHKVKNAFIFVLFMYYWCEEYYKPTPVQYSIANYVTWLPRLTMLDLETNWT